jgi:adenylate kinase
MLNEHGIRCTGLNEIAESSGALQNGTVDVDRLASVHIESGIVESHYSHFMNCSHVIILVDDENALRRRMELRGYSQQKINENLDAQRAQTIYYEALDRLPAGRIYIIEEKSRNLGEVFQDIISILAMTKHMQ